MTTIQNDMQQTKNLLEDIKEYLEQGQGTTFQETLRTELAKVPYSVTEEVVKIGATVVQRADKALQEALQVKSGSHVVLQAPTISDFANVLSPATQLACAFDPYAEIVSDATQQMMTRARRKRRHIRKLR